MENFELAQAYIAAIAGDANAHMSFRCIHDTDKGQPGRSFDGTLAEHWPTFQGYQSQGWGVFVNINALDGRGRELHNVSALRAHVVDLDAVDAAQMYQAAAQWKPAPTFAVESSEGRYHVYWCLSETYSDGARYSALQRRIRQEFHGDKSVVDPTRVLRLAGTYNFKRSEPVLVTCHALAGWNDRPTVDQLEASLSHVTVVEGDGERHELGDVSLAAPSVSWLKRAMELVDPNDLSREEWVSFTAGVKQAGWTLLDPDALFAVWSEWCSRYEHNDLAENVKNWSSIRNTQLGWPSLVRRVPSLRAAMSFGEGGAPSAPVAVPSAGAPVAVTPPMPEPKPLDCKGEMLTHLECEQWFKGCVFVTRFGKILTPKGEMLNATQFNGGEYAGKHFIISQGGKTTDEPWKAATRSTMWSIPKVDNIRFLPSEPPGTIVTDVLGRKGVNYYVTPNVRRVQGDPAPFLNHLAAIIPDGGDRKIMLDWMAHVVKFPGFKIPWAPVIQSAEGIGKGVIKYAMTHAVGQPYVHFPNAQQLGDSGGKFNGWMRGKVFILADEIKVDEKRHMVEVLKPLISEELIEVQSKGADQEMEDNPACWGFFTNYKDAVPVTRNGRRYAMFFSPIQTEDDLFARGMGDEYMKALFTWLKADGAAIVADYLLSYPIERGDIPMRAPKTTSWAEAVQISRSPIERAISEAVEANAPGFAGGWVSEIAAANRIREVSAVRGNVPPHVIRGVLESMGYVEVGRQIRPYLQEDRERMGSLYHHDRNADVAAFGVAQGYEVVG